MIWWALAADAATLNDRLPSTSVDTQQPGTSRNSSTPTEPASWPAVAAPTRVASPLCARPNGNASSTVSLFSGVSTAFRTIVGFVVQSTGLRRATAVHITCRYASTTATDARTDADVLPNANLSAATATRPLSRAAALFTPSRRGSFYLATGQQSGWPYVQHGGGPPEFLKVLGDKAFGFADFRGDSQYISVGNVGANDRAALMLMDYPNRRRAKVYAHAELRDLKDGTDLAPRLASFGYKAKVERAVLLRLELPAALHRARVGASARAGQVAHPRPGKRGEGAQRRQLLPDQRGESGTAGARGLPRGYPRNSQKPASSPSVN